MSGRGPPPSEPVVSPRRGSDRAGLVRPLRLPILRRLPARCNRRSLGRDSGLAGLDCLRAACGIRSSCRPVFEHPASCSLRDLRDVTATDGQSRCGSLRNDRCRYRAARRQQCGALSFAYDCTDFADRLVLYRGKLFPSWCAGGFSVQTNFGWVSQWGRYQYLSRADRKAIGVFGRKFRYHTEIA